MAFYAHATELVSPGDIFPEIPISVTVPPIRVARKSKFNPPLKFGPQDLRRIFTLPADEEKVPGLQIRTKAGEETLASTRIGLAMLLSWGSQVEADERELQRTGRAKGKAWLAAPIYSLELIPDQAVYYDPETRESVRIREIVRHNASHNYFHLPAFPSGDVAGEHYLDFRKITAIGIQFFIETKNKRLATLAEESLNLLFSRLMWFFTRAEYFFQPVRCPTCGNTVPLDIRFKGQNFDAEPWQ